MDLPSGIAVDGVNNGVDTGVLNGRSFNANLAAAIGAGELDGHNAVLFSRTAGASRDTCF